MRCTSTSATRSMREGDRRSVRMQIVGRVVLPEKCATARAMRDNVPGLQAAETRGARVRLRGPHRARSGPRQATLARRLGAQYAHPAPGPPQTVADFGGVRNLPVVVSALLAAIAAAALAHTLVTAIRRRRRQLAVLKTSGFDRRQLLATVAWQATTFAAIGLSSATRLGSPPVAGRGTCLPSRSRSSRSR